MKSYRTVHEAAEKEIVISKSRFIGYVKPVSTEEEAQAFVDEIRKKHRTATHNVPVYLLGEDHSIQKYSDDGEPSGTAGVPILNMLKNEGITDVALVITRYFGGVKLGTGGLVRAYTQSAKEALEVAKVIEMVKYELVRVRLEYNQHGKIQHYLENNPQYLLKDTLYTDKVEVLIYTRREDEEALMNKVTEICCDVGHATVLEEAYLAISNGEWVK
ncbi:MAG: YigZ family protein [Clostridia bacterium]|nr:YigZ family protein [Clostridia bacterium]